MSPRPVEFPEFEFQAAVGMARGGRGADALRLIEESLAAREGREARAGAAVQALVEVARCAESAGEGAVAERALDLAIELRPRYADLHYQRACVLLGRQRRGEARRSLDTALALNPNYTAARVERALLDAREGLVGDALEALRGVARDLPIEDPRSFQKGLKSLERADWDSGDALIRRALKISDPELERQLERVEALFQQEQPAGAAQLLREIIERHEAYPDLHYMLARAEAELGHHDDALASLARALELNPDFHAARIQFARVLDSVGMRNPAAEQLGLVLQQEPGHRQALDLERDWSGRGHRTPARLAAHVDPDPEAEAA